MGINVVIDAVRDETDFPIDAYGATMSALFGIADAMWHNGISIPARWEYRHGMGCQYGDDDATRAMTEIADSHGWEPVIQAAEILMRYRDLLKANGQDY
jgi:hypothetical protein